MVLTRRALTCALLIILFMAFFCDLCRQTYPTRRSFRTHNTRVHRHPKPKAAVHKLLRHPLLNAIRKDGHGNVLPAHAPPPPEDLTPSWESYEDRPTFEIGEILFEKMKGSAEDMNHLFRAWAAKNVLDNNKDAPYVNNADLLSRIDALEFNAGAWEATSGRWTGRVTDESAAWKRTPWTMYMRNTREVFSTMVSNPEFRGKFDTRPYREYAEAHTRRYSDCFSGEWAWRQCNTIAREDPSTRGSMFVPIIIGTDKTTVSVATGHQEFHPVYGGIMNTTNSVRRAHAEAIVPIAFLAIPKGSRADDDDPEFRLFKKQLYHASLARILEPLRDAMSKPVLTKCFDGYYRDIIYGLGPVLADYPEQVFLSGIVQGWCPKCLALPEQLKTKGPPRFQEHTECLRETYDSNRLWDVWGVNDDVTPFTEHFPRADIHELLTPDLLHQLIKGTFKDHLVTWVEDYIKANHSKADAESILDDIDRKIAAAPPFPGLRRFPEGRKFKQWTGDDSKALMKVYIPAIVDHVPAEMVQAIVAFSDFCYIARRSSHDTRSLRLMDIALARFHKHRNIFLSEGIRNDFALPRQHSLVHYTHSIKLFGSPNGVCTSITESKHIRAVKEPWRHSSRNDPISQILLRNTRMMKISAARARFGRKGMLRGDVYQAALAETGRAGVILDDDNWDVVQNRMDDHAPDEDVFDIGDEHAPLSVRLAKKPLHSRTVSQLATELSVSAGTLHTQLGRFLYGQIHRDPDLDPDDVPVDELPGYGRSIQVFSSAHARYYSPSELSGPFGMHSEVIRSHPSWFGQYERRDTVLVGIGEEDDPMGGMTVARIMRFLRLRCDGSVFPCALVEWFLPVDDTPDPLTGMWIVRPETVHGSRPIDIVPLDSIFRACHLMGRTSSAFLPRDFNFSYSHTAFRTFYLNKYADYHSHECFPSSVDLYLEELEQLEAEEQ